MFRVAWSWSAALALAAAFLIPGSPAWASPNVQLEPQRVDVAGTSIAYAEIGEGSPLLMLNGTASPMNEWDPALLRSLAQQHRVIVLDYPGLGLSGSAPSTWDFSAAAGWMAEFIHVVSPLEPVDVLGWSMGGFIAQRLAIEYPQTVHRLVLASTNPGGKQAVLGPRWVQRADSRGGISAYLRTNYPADQRNAGDRFISRLHEAVASGRYPQESVPSATRRAMVRAEDPWLRDDMNVHDLQGVRARTLVITGAMDVITPPINSRVIARSIPDAELELLPDAGHSFLFQRPVNVARIVSDFLRQ